MLRLRTLLLAACFAVAPAAAAQADVTYDMVTAAHGTWELHQRQDLGGGDFFKTEDFKLGFAYSAPYQDVRFTDGQFVDFDLAPIPDVEVVVFEAKVVTKTPASTTTATCDVGHADLLGEPMLHRVDQTPGSERLAFRPGEHLEVMLRCEDEGGVFHTTFDLLAPGVGGESGPTPEGPLDLEWAIPHETIGMDYAEHLVTPRADQTSLAKCPGRDTDTVSCTLSWEGRVTMRRTGGGPPVPPVDPRAEAIRGAVESYGPNPRAEAISGAVEQYAPTRPVKAELRGGALQFTAGCPAGCAGTATIVDGGGAKPRAAKARTLARLRFSVPAGPPRRVKVPLSRAARKAVRRARRPKVTIVLKPKAGAPVRLTLPVRR